MPHYLYAHYQAVQNVVRRLKVTQKATIIYKCDVFRYQPRYFGKVTSYKLGDLDIFHDRGSDFYINHRVQKGFAFQPASFPADTGNFTLGVKQPQRDDHSPLSSSELKNA
jgi:hypothetical protein